MSVQEIKSSFQAEMNHYGNWLVSLTETAAFQMSALELMSSSLPGKSCFVVSSDWRGGMKSIAMHEVSGVRAALPLLSQGGDNWRRAFFSPNWGYNVVAVANQFKYYQHCPVCCLTFGSAWKPAWEEMLPRCAQLWCGKASAVLTAWIWICIAADTKAYVAGSFLSSHRSPKVWLISCKPHALISSSSV